MSEQQANDGGSKNSSNSSSTSVDGQRKRARGDDEAHADEKPGAAQIDAQADAAQSTGLDARSTKQPKLKQDTQAADQSTALGASDANGGSLAPVHAAASAPGASAVQHSHAQPSAMLRCLTLCRDVQFTLMQMLELEDLAKLDATCRTWRLWMQHPPLLDGLKYTLEGRWPRLQAQLGSRWLPQLITLVEQQMFRYIVDTEVRFSNGTIQQQCEQCSVMLRTLPRCTRARQLALNIREAPQAALDACFAGFARTLASLRVITHGPDALLLQSLFRSLHPLRSLEQLFVQGQSITPDIDFSALPLMPRLLSFVLQRADPTKNTWRCSPAQVQCLASCPSLSSLSCGVWHSDDLGLEDAFQPITKAISEPGILNGIGALVSGWLDVPAAGSHSPATPRHPSITYLDLHSTIITAAVWEHVSRLTSLTTLRSEHWLTWMRKPQWAKLANFVQLQQLLLVCPIPSLVFNSVFVPPLLSCVRLHTLELGGVHLTRDHLRALCTGLALLTKLTVMFGRLEDCAPLALASRLLVLQAGCCRTSGAGAPIQFRSALPAMAQLTQLWIIDIQTERLTAEQAAPLNAALFARMPLLMPAKFTQNLLPAAPAPVAAEVPALQV